MSGGISIVVPTYNRSDMLRESLVNLNQRTQYAPKEIIVVDGGSEPEELPKYQQIKSEGLCDKIVFRAHFPKDMPGTEKMKNLGNSYLAGLHVSDKSFPYIHFGADDLFYRTGWVEALTEMIDSEWAKRHNVKLISGFNHWCNPNDRAKMLQYVPETYKSKDGSVEGYAAEWGGNYFIRKDEFIAMGGFVNNVSKTLRWDYQENFEVILHERFLEKNWHWGATVETYVQTMAIAQSSLLGNYKRDDGGTPVTDEHFCNGIAVGYAWKDI